MIAPDAVSPEALPVVIAIAFGMWVLVIAKGWYRG